MASLSRILPAALALAGGMATGAAQAQQQPPTYHYFEAGFSSGLMSVSADSDHIGADGWMVGYRFNKNVGVQATGFSANTPFHQKLAGDGTPLYDFARYAGVQVVGYIPATSSWDIYGAVGVGRSIYGTAQPGFGNTSKTDGVIEGGLRWQVFQHFATSIELVRVLDAQSTYAALRAEVNF